MAAEVNEEDKKMKVFVAIPRPRRDLVALEVSSDYTVASVKATLHKMEGIPPRRQRLVFTCSALPDDNGTTLADHGLVDSSTFQLVETKMQVFVHCMHSSPLHYITVSDVESSDTVESFRLRLQQREDIGLRPAQQRLVYNGRQLEDGHTLADYGVRDSTSMQLLSRPTRQRLRVVELDIDITDTVGRIKERVEEAEGVPVACQSVFHHGEELNNGRALADYDTEWVYVECLRYETRGATNPTTPMVAETETIKRRSDVEVTSPEKEIKQKMLPEIPAVQRRPFRVHLIGPELEAICRSSCDTDPAY